MQHGGIKVTKDSKCLVGRAHKKRRNVWEEVAREKERGQRKSFGAIKHGRLEIFSEGHDSRYIVKDGLNSSFLEMWLRRLDV